MVETVKIKVPNGKTYTIENKQDLDQQTDGSTSPIKGKFIKEKPIIATVKIHPFMEQPLKLEVTEEEAAQLVKNLKELEAQNQKL